MKHFKLMKGVLACLLSLVLVVTSYGSVGLQAAETATTSTVVAPTAVNATYNPADDTIATAGKVVYVLKSEKGNTIKKGAKCYSVSTTAADNTLTAIGVKSTAKDAYLYVCDKEFEEDGKNINANLVIKGQAAKKIVGVIDYTQADDKDSTKVLSITATDKNKKAIENPVALWSEDGTTWNDSSVSGKEYKGSDLIKKLEAGGGVIYVKMKGDANTRTSKAIKVKIAKQGKAPTVKVDVKKDTFSIKNGMDFGLFTKSGEKYTLVGTWNTVLPQLKTAKTKTLDDSVVSTKIFTPVGKKDASATKTASENSGKVSYTSLKIKAIGYDKLISQLETSGSGVDISAKEYYVGVRTSATEKKPASAVTYFKLTEKTAAPIVYTESKVKDQYLIASGTDFAKKGILLGTIANYNGANGTKGYDDSFELKTGVKGADTNAGSYEFAIVNKADWDASQPSYSGEAAAIDWSTVSWKKLDPAKTKINAKLKTKYSTTAKSGITATLTAGTQSASGAPTTGDIPEDVKTVILVRRAGVKGKTAEESVVASEIIPLYVLKDGKNYNIYSTKSIGEEAVKYTVEFYKWTGSTSGETTTYAWTKDDSLTVTGWGKSSTEKPTMPAIENAVFWALDDNAAKLSGSGALTLSNGKWEVSVGAAGSDEVVKKVAIREYANVKVVAAVSASGETTATESDLASVKAGKVGTATTVTAYVGSPITIEDIATPTVANYDVAAGSSTSEVTIAAGSSDTKKNITFTVNKAEEVTIKVPYVKTPKEFGVTETVDTGASLTDKTGITSNKATYNTDVTFKVNPGTKKVVNTVSYKVGTAAAVTITADGDGVYTIPGDKITDALTITVTVKDEPEA